ncbi:MAG: acyl carrier protein [Chloroflexota bacterium]
MTDQILVVLQEYARLSVPAEALTSDSNLYRAGMTSHASVNVMLALESEFDIEFPDRMLRRSVFESIGAISHAIEELRAAG